MDSVQCESNLMEIEELRKTMIALVNKKADELRNHVLNDNELENSQWELEYPLDTMPAIFKGKKPAAVIFHTERVNVKTWHNIFVEILVRCNADKKAHNTLMELRNRIVGRKRTIVSDKSENMVRPFALSDELYVETHFDTEWLFRILTKYILEVVGYDYSDIKVVVKM